MSKFIFRLAWFLASFGFFWGLRKTAKNGYFWLFAYLEWE